MQIDGKKINQEIGQKLLAEIQSKNLKPSLGIFSVGSDRPSASFIRVKKSFGEKYGFTVNTLNVPETYSLVEVAQAFVQLQSQNDSMILQLPLPEKFKDKTEFFLGLIEKEKDVDNLSGGNFQAPIVLALEEIFKFYKNCENISDENILQKRIGLIGLGQVVGMPIKNYLEEKNYSVEIIKKGEEEKIKDCDIVISGVGKPYFIKKDFINAGSVLIDYGCSFVVDEFGREYACGDFDPECFLEASYYTPVPGCMGPLVVACLFQNVLEASLSKN